jgi:hypothetical protein
MDGIRLSVRYQFGYPVFANPETCADKRIIAVVRGDRFRTMIREN